MNSQKDNLKVFHALSLAWQLGFLIVIPVGGFLLLGFLGDQYLNTKPILLILGLFIGIIITIYEIYNLIVPIVTEEKNKD